MGTFSFSHQVERHWRVNKLVIQATEKRKKNNYLKNLGVTLQGHGLVPLATGDQ